MSHLRLYYVFLIGIFTNVDAAKILAYIPTPSISHQVVIRPILLELVKRGHEVTFLTTDPIFPKGDGPAHLKEIDLHNASYSFINPEISKTIVEDKEISNQLFMIKIMIGMMLEKQVEEPEVKRLFQNRKEKFDLIILEAMFTPALGVLHLFDAPTILFSSFGKYPGDSHIFGIPDHPIIYHNIFHKRLYNLTLWEKIREVYYYFKIHYILNASEENDNKLLQKVFGPDCPPLKELRKKVDMLFLNINPIWEGSHPVPPNVIHMGGLPQKPHKELPKELQNYLDNSKNGVIYFSLGSNVRPSLLPPDKIAIFEKVLSTLPYNVLMKWDTDSYQPKSKNIKVSKWLPQSDLLRHPNIRAFITQGGLQSTDEAISAGVPLVGIPLFGDQWYNVEKYVYHKIGVKLDFASLTEEQFRNAIMEVTKNESYRENMVRLRTLMQDQAQTPLERAVWWAEYVIRHGGAKHLRAPAANMSWAEFLELELVFYVTLTIFTLLGLITMIIIRLANYVLNYRLKKKKVKSS